MTPRALALSLTFLLTPLATGIAVPEGIAAPAKKKKEVKKAKPRSKPAPVKKAPPPPEPPPSSDLVPASSLRGPTRLDFDDRLIQGQTNKSGAVYLFDRKETGISSMVRRRKSFRHLTIRTVYDQ